MIRIKKKLTHLVLCIGLLGYASHGFAFDILGAAGGLGGIFNQVTKGSYATEVDMAVTALGVLIPIAKSAADGKPLGILDAICQNKDAIVDGIVKEAIDNQNTIDEINEYASPACQVVAAIDKIVQNVESGKPILEQVTEAARAATGAGLAIAGKDVDLTAVDAAYEQCLGFAKGGNIDSALTCASATVSAGLGLFGEPEENASGERVNDAGYLVDANGIPLNCASPGYYTPCRPGQASGQTALGPNQAVNADGIVVNATTGQPLNCAPDGTPDTPCTTASIGNYNAQNGITPTTNVTPTSLADDLASALGNGNVPNAQPDPYNESGVAETALGETLAAKLRETDVMRANTVMTTTSDIAIAASSGNLSEIAGETLEAGNSVVGAAGAAAERSRVQSDTAVSTRAVLQVISDQLADDLLFGSIQADLLASQLRIQSEQNVRTTQALTNISRTLVEQHNLEISKFQEQMAESVNEIQRQVENFQGVANLLKDALDARSTVATAANEFGQP